jgi:hypothetical protein
MKRLTRVTAGALMGFTLSPYCCAANAEQPNPEIFRPAVCDQFDIDGRASAPLRGVVLPPSQRCTTRISNGFPIPDPNCTPGAINPTLRIEVLKDPRFRTTCIRDAATKEEEKATTYEWYNLRHPFNNSGESQICELYRSSEISGHGCVVCSRLWFDSPPSTERAKLEPRRPRRASGSGPGWWRTGPGHLAGIHDCRPG